MPAPRIGLGGTMALLTGHCAGMLDLIALPVWVGALVERYDFSPQQGGGLVTIFLLGAVTSSAIVAPRLNRVNPRFVATVGYTAAAIAFTLASLLTSFMMLAAMHLIAGSAVGIALSMIHGCIGRSENPHRLYAIGGIAIGLLGIMLLSVIPQVLVSYGRAALFQVFGTVMAFAAIACGILLSNPPQPKAEDTRRFPRAIWFIFLGVSVMTFNQAMVFSFVEVIGKHRGFEINSVLMVLVVLAFVNLLLPSPLAVYLQKRVSASVVIQLGPAAQAILAVVVTSSTIFPLWALAAMTFVSVQIFTHTFAFGLLAALDPSGRAVAATPATLMIGAALGPLAGGALAENIGFGALGMLAVITALISILLFRQSRSENA